MLRLMVRVPLTFKSPNSVAVRINKKCFNLTVRENALGQIRNGTCMPKSTHSSSFSSDSDELGSSNNLVGEDDFRTVVYEDSIEQFSFHSISADVNSKDLGMFDMHLSA